MFSNRFFQMYLQIDMKLNSTACTYTHRMFNTGFFAL